MGARKPKPTALKERTSVRSNLGLSRLFSAANALVPFKTDELSKPNSGANSESRVFEREPTNHALELEVTRATNIKPLPPFEASEYGTAVVVKQETKQQARNRRARPDTGDETKTQAISARTSVTTLKKAESKSRELPMKTLAMFLLVPATALFSYAIFETVFDTSVAKTVSRHSELSTQQINERLAYHRSITGADLNRQRIDVQIQNFRQAPDLGFNDHKVKPPNMMDGLPLAGEQINTGRTVKKDLPYDPTYSEARIAYGLQEEQSRAQFEQQAQRQWIKDFVSNAHKDGYEVKIDQFGNVKAAVIPLQQRGPLPDDSELYNRGL